MPFSLAWVFTLKKALCNCHHSHCGFLHALPDRLAGLAAHFYCTGITGFSSLMPGLDSKMSSDILQRRASRRG